MEGMKHFTFDNRWDEIKGKLKQRYGQLADDDLTFAEGKGDELLARLREKLGVSSDDLNGILDELYGANGDRGAAVREKAAEIAAEVRAKASAAAHEAKAQAEIVYDQARQQANSFWHDGEEYIRRNPRESLVTALFAGFVAGLLIRR
jgi:uncharacterized protein YjbJ (UPF0337 family)